MPGICFNLEMEIINWLDAEAKRTGHNRSFLANHYFNEAKKGKPSYKTEILTCKKIKPDGSVCGASYSSKLGKCPSCDLRDAEAEIITQTEDRNNQANLINTEIARVKSENERLSTAINLLDEGTQDQDALIKKLAENSEKLKALNERLGMLF